MFMRQAHSIKSTTNGTVVQEVNETFISYLIFNLVKIPNYRSIPDDERIEELIHVFFCRVGTG